MTVTTVCTEHVLMIEQLRGIDGRKYIITVVCCPHTVITWLERKHTPCVLKISKLLNKYTHSIRNTRPYCEFVTKNRMSSMTILYSFLLYFDNLIHDTQFARLAEDGRIRRFESAGARPWTWPGYSRTRSLPLHSSTDRITPRLFYRLLRSPSTHKSRH